MNYSIELKRQEKDNRLTISIHIIDLPIGCIENLASIKESAAKEIDSYLRLLNGDKVNNEKSQGNR